MSPSNSVDRRSTLTEREELTEPGLLNQARLKPPFLGQTHRVILILVGFILVLIPLFIFDLPTPLLFTLWLLFGSGAIWVGVQLDDFLHPERRVYRRVSERCSRIVRETSDAAQLLDDLCHTLFQTLALESLTLWRHQAEESTLTLLRYEGALTVGDLAELPVDLTIAQLHGARPVTALPESALRQGLLALGTQVVLSLSLGEELIGLVALGRAGFGRGYNPEMLRWLDLMAGQLALVVKNASLIGDLEETIKKLQAAYRRTIEAEAEERHRLAIELHDDILSRLTTVTMALHHSRSQVEAPAVEAQAQLETTIQEVGYISRRLREITQGLHPSVLSDLGLISALQAYMDSLSKQVRPASTGVTIALTAQGFADQRLAEPKLERDVYYITRQALDNALKHAGADQIFIHLRWLEDALSITVQDTGCGLKDAPEQLMGQNGRLGLLSMYERTLAWQGRLTIQTGQGQGTTIHARIPIDQPSQAPTHLQAFTHYLR